MSVIRVQKSKDFTTMSNIHLRDKELSLKAKGLMSVMLSLPDDWNYSVAGLCAICKEKETAVKNTLNELRERRYVIVERIEPSEETGGRIQYEYFVYEKPQGAENKKVDVKEAYKAKQEQEKQLLKKQEVENLGVEILPAENTGGILNTNKLNTNNNKSLLSVERGVSESDQPEPETKKSKSVTRKKEASALFEQLWSLYPLKKGKGQVSETQKLKILDIGFEEMERAVSRYAKYVDSVDYLHYKNGSTFFNSGYIDYLDENYVEYSDGKNESFSKSNSDPKNINNAKETDKQEKESYQSKLEKAKQMAGDEFGEEYREKFWEGMSDGDIEGTLGILGIFLNEI